MHQNSIVVDLSISADEYLKLYQGVAKNVFTRARDGRSIRFPARVLQPFVTHSGVHGAFRLHFDAQMKFQSIHRL